MLKASGPVTSRLCDTCILVFLKTKQLGKNGSFEGWMMLNGVGFF